MKDTGLEIEIILSDGEIKKGFAKIKNESDKASKQIGNSFSKNVENKIAAPIGLITKQIGAVGVALAASFGAKAVIDAANRQENAVNKLNGSLRSLGFNSDQIRVVSKDLQGYASELQKVTTYGDEAILEQIAFAQAMGATADQSKLIVNAATDMAAALNIDLNSAVRNISKTLGGYAGELGEVIPELKNLTKEQLQTGDGIDLLAAKYKGFAENDTRTFQGRTQQLSNAFGDLVEEVGKFVTNSDTAKEAISKITGAVNGLIKAIRPDSLDDVNTQVTSLQSKYDGLIAQKQKIQSEGGLFESFKLNSINKEIRFTEELLDKLKGKAERLRLAQAADDQVNTDLEKVRSEEERKNQLIQEIRTLGFNDLQLLESNFQQQKELLNEANRLGAIQGEVGYQERLTNLQAHYSAQRAAIVEREAAKMRASAINVGRVVSTNLARSVSGGMQTIVTSVMNGENAFANLSKFALNSVGEMSIQLGEMFIATGMATDAFKNIQGGQAIAAGLALVALGQIAKSYSGPLGGGSSSNIGTGQNLGPGTSFNENDQEIITPINGEERQAPGTSVQLVVQGNVLNTQETADNLVSLLNNAFEERGLRVNGAIA